MCDEATPEAGGIAGYAVAAGGIVDVAGAADAGWFGSGNGAYALERVIVGLKAGDVRCCE